VSTDASALGKLLQLPRDWNSYDALPIDIRAIRTAENIQAVPTNIGGVQLELHAGGVDVEVEIAPDGHVISVYWALATTPRG